MCVLIEFYYFKDGGFDDNMSIERYYELKQKILFLAELGVIKFTNDTKIL